MHETSLMQFTLDAVERKCLQMNIRHVKSIRIVVGDLRGALPDLMQEAFRILTYKRPVFHGAALEIETRPVVLRCASCGGRFTPEAFHAVRCPACGAAEYTVEAGNELYIDSFEGEETP